MSILTLLFSLAFLGSNPNYVQNQTTVDTLSASMINENGLLSIGNSEHWKYQPGDNMEWAEPDFDDSGWHDISPDTLAIDEMPDSLWNGYGWWRYTFTADSSFYEENWNLYFFGWGAAEVYLDGKLLQRYGTFSIYPDEENTYSPVRKILPPIDIHEHDTHTIAVRYSYHQAKRYNVLMKENARNLGFGFGFGTHGYNEYTAQIITYESFTLFFSSAVLFVLFLLHLMLFYKFPEDRSNLFIAIAVGLLLISDVAVHSYVYTNVTMYWYAILRLIWAFSASFAFIFLPYVTASIFRIEKLKKVIWLTAGYPLFVITTFLNLELANYIALLLFSISIFLLGYICWQAFTLGKRGVYFVTCGVLGTLILVVIYVLTVIGFIEMSFGIYSMMIAFIYTLFPLGLTLYVADSYGYLFTSLEKEVSDRTKKLKESLEDLKAAQDQLVQQEKLASLGQLTAGIAHEIKNPLNFVNNFSDLSIELVEEARDEVKALAKSPFEGGKDGEADQGDDHGLILDILNDVETNLRKIHEHGSRADGIVKSMLQHSRGGDGKMEPTDLNALVKEYVNLAFHGMRASKNPINVDIDLNLDETTGEIQLIAEDFSRVIVNLCNNAFDAMREKLSTVSSQQSEKSPTPLPRGEGRRGEGEYSPKLTVQTHQKNQNITIQIEDNGPGISDEIKEKILQPFFTTKKGTEGTGLGLSITHDIINAHGGHINIESEPGSTCFIITLPDKQNGE